MNRVVRSMSAMSPSSPNGRCGSAPSSPKSPVSPSVHVLGRSFGKEGSHKSPQLRGKPKYLSPTTEKYPGPGQYDVAYALDKAKLKRGNNIRLLGKPKEIFDPTARVPGPGAYDVNGSESKTLNHGKIGFAMKGKPKYLGPSTLTPGPNAYTLPRNPFSAKGGAHILGKWKEVKVMVTPGLKYSAPVQREISSTPRGATIMGKWKDSKPLTIVPGPGHY
jgi:hypothetical protein